MIAPFLPLQVSIEGVFVYLWRETIIDRKFSQSLAEKQVIEETQAPTKVFISYSWDSEEHKEHVKELANTLRDPCGIETDIDEYVRAKPPFTPPKGWDVWMEKRIEWAEFVLIVCTETYKRRFRGDEEPGIGQGVTWEGTIIRQHLYNNQLENTKFIPVVFSSPDLDHVPIILNGNDKYILEDKKSFEKLIYRLRKEPIIAIPEIATAKLQAPSEPKFFSPQKPPTEPRRQANLAHFKAAIQEKVDKQFLLDPALEDVLRDSQQQVLNLTDENVADIWQQITAGKDGAWNQQKTQLQAQEKQLLAAEFPQEKALTEEFKPLQDNENNLSQTEKQPALQLLLQTFEFDVVTLDAQGNQISCDRLQAQSFTEILSKDIELEMVVIPGGTFLMGSLEGEGVDSEKPQHSVTVPSFLMGKYPVTQAQWKVVAALPKVERDLAPDPAFFKGDNRPVERVSWHDAVEFCQRLSQQTGRIYRLPSEAEWEYACRAGTTTPFHFGETITTDVANYSGELDFMVEEQYQEQTTFVDSFPANAFGLHDMHGNVEEWCEDKWHSHYTEAPTDGSARVDWTFLNNRVVRGGSWFDFFPQGCRSADRNSLDPDRQSYYVGFRVVYSPLQREQQRQTEEQKELRQQQAAEEARFKRRELERQQQEQLKQAAARSKLLDPPPNQSSEATQEDYAQLEALLKAGKWREADQETSKQMCQVMGRQSEGWLRIEDIERFPCADLRVIDQLWVTHSNGKFGFSVQKKIWQQCGSPTEYNQQWEKFGEAVGWRSKRLMGIGAEWKSYSALTFEPSSASLGQLPRYWLGGLFVSSSDLGFLIGVEGLRVSASFLARRCINCSI